MKEINKYYNDQNQPTVMKRRHFSAALMLTVAASLVFTSCIGSFKLSNKVLAWNQQIGSKFVNEVVFFCFWIIPVYEITALADVLVLNSIEFWSGRNPVTAETKVIDGKDAQYQIERDMAGYTITNMSDGKAIRFDFNEIDNSWSLNTGDKSIKFLEFVDDNHVRVLGVDGEFDEVELSQEGVYAYQQSIMASQFAYK